MKIALVTDSSSYLTKDEIKDNNIVVVPIPVIVDEKSYEEGINITAEQLFQMENSGAGFPKTSQPGMGKMMELFNKLHNENYDAIIVITLAGTISGFYQTLKNIAHNYPDYHLYPYDSKITTHLQGYMAIAAARMIKKGYTPEKIITELDKISKTVGEVFVVDDLKNLSRGGRLSNASAFIGSILQIKPLLTFDDESDKIVAFDKVRSMKRAIKKAEQVMLDQTKNSPYIDRLRFVIIHSNDLEQAKLVKDFVQNQYPSNPITIDEFGPVVATHLGEKSIGITWMLDIDKLTF